MNTYLDLRQRLLHGHDPYANYPFQQWAGTWYDDPGAKRTVFDQVLGEAKPTIIIEVGSFVGESTIYMAKILRKVAPGSVIIAVDTWLGGIDHWLKVPEKLKFWFGRPGLYYQFLGNVMAHQCQDIVLPLTLDSLNAARLLAHLQISADFIYVDASHEQGDALRDFEAYWDRLNRYGVLMADDLTNWFPGVVKDWETFLRKHNLKGKVDGEKGWVSKP